MLRFGLYYPIWNKKLIKYLKKKKQNDQYKLFIKLRIINIDFIITVKMIHSTIFRHLLTIYIYKKKKNKNRLVRKFDYS